MDSKSGDGTVLEENAILDGAQNYIINGTCQSVVKPLHTDLINADLYPKVYEIIKDALEED